MVYSDGAEDDSAGWGGEESGSADDNNDDGGISADFTGLRIVTNEVVGMDGADQP